jgi:hypothetical protein
MRTLRFAMFVAPLTLALAAAPALARGPGGEGACRGAKEQLKKLCSGGTPGDCLTTLCKDVQPGPGQWPQCLLNLNSAGTLKPSLTKDCVTDLNNKLAAIQKWQATFQTACGGDVTNFCNNVTGGVWSTKQCLRQAVLDNKQVSKDCQALLAQRHGHGDHPDGPGKRGPTK